MTRLLEQAFAKVAELPDDEQDAVAALILGELAAEKRWDEAFRASPDQLAILAEEALDEFRRGATQPLDPLP